MLTHIVVVGLTGVLLGTGFVHAATIVSGSVRVGPGDLVTCIAPNPGTKNVPDVEINITFNQVDGSFSSGASGSCPDVLERQACTVASFHTNPDYSAFCTIKSKGKLRGTFCNETKGLCSDAR